MPMMIPDSSFLLRRELDTKNKHGELAEAKVICGFYTSERDVQEAKCVDMSLSSYMCVLGHVHLCGTLCAWGTQ